MAISPTRPDLLARIDALPDRAVDVCRLAGLTVQFISAMRNGKGQRADVSDWARLEAAIKLCEDRAALGRGQSPEAATSVVTGEHPRVIEMSRAFEKATTLDEWILCQRTLTSLSALGLVDPARVRVLNEAVARGIQLFRAKAEEDERARAGEEMIVVVKYVDAWRKP